MHEVWGSYSLPRPSPFKFQSVRNRTKIFSLDIVFSSQMSFPEVTSQCQVSYLDNVPDFMTENYFATASANDHIDVAVFQDILQVTFSNLLVLSTQI